MSEVAEALDSCQKQVIGLLDEDGPAARDPVG